MNFPTVIKSGSPFRMSWDLFILILVLVTSILIPFQLAFDHVPFGWSSLFLYALDLVFLFDIFLNFRTSYRERGREVLAPELIASNYRRSMFIVDLVATIPVDVIFYIFAPGARMMKISTVLVLRLFRLLRLMRLITIFRRWESESWTHSGYLRIGKFCCIVVLFIHWMACGWFFTSYTDGFSPNCWVTKAGIEGSVTSDQYIRSLYWAITTMTTVGYGDIAPQRRIEYIFASITMIIGASLYAFIIGNIASIFGNLDTAKVHYWGRVESVSQFLRYRNVSAELNARVWNYYDYLWARHRGLNEGRIFDDLPRPLRLELLFNLTQELLKKVPLFRHASPLLRDELLTCLNMQTHCPGSFVARKGETGREIFFISRGEAVILNGDDDSPYDTLGAGDYFGDFTLIFKEKRTASVQTTEYCEIFVLNEDDFHRIKDENPEFKEVLKKVSSEKQDKTSNFVMDGIIL